MSMNYYAETGYGIFLADDEMMIFARKMYEEDRQKLEEVDDDPEEDILEILYDLPDSILISDNDFDKRNVFFLDGKDHIWDFANGLMLYAKKQGHIFKGEEDQLYSGPDEMAKEFEDRYGKYLPDNFDIKSRLCYFAGAVFL